MANQEIRQEINLFNRVNSGIAVDAAEMAYYDPADYNGETEYFEIVYKNADASDRSVYLHDSSDNIHATITAVGSTATYTRARVAVSTTLTADTYHVNVTDADISIIAARIVILQDAATITATATYVEVGCYEQISWEVGASLTYPKYWYYDSTMWDPTPTFDFHLTYLGTKEDFYVNVQYSYDFNAWTDVATSPMLTLTTEAVTHDRSLTGLTLTDKAWYRVEVWCGNDKYPPTIYNAHIVLKQSDVGGIIKCVPEYHMINAPQASTGETDHFTYFDPAEWNDEDGYTHLVHCMDCEDDADSVSIQDAANNVLDGSDILGNADSKDQQSFSISPGAKIWNSANKADICTDCGEQGVAQRYPGDGGKAIGFLINIEKVASPGDLLIELRNDDTSLPGGTQHASATIDDANIEANNRWPIFLFDSGYDTTDGTDYWCCAVHTGGGVGVNYYDVYRNAVGRELGAARNGSWASGAGNEYAFNPIEAMDMPTAQNLNPDIEAVTGNINGSRILVFYKYVAAGGDLSASVTESMTIGESISRNMPLGAISVVEVMTIAESITPDIPLAVSIADSITIAESLGDDLPLSSQPVDTITIAELLTLLKDFAGPELSDVMTIGELIDIALPLSPSIAESLAIVEAITHSVGEAAEDPEASVTDTVTISEAITLLMNLESAAVTDTVTIADVISLILNLGASVSDTITISESISLIKDFAGPELSDTVTISEAIQLILNLDVAPSDVVTIAESINLLFSLEPRFSESMTIAEAITAAMNLESGSVTDAITISEAISGAIELRSSVTDVITMGEDISISFVSAITKLLTDTITISESISLLMHILPQVTETVTISESILRGMNLGDIVVTDSLGIAEDISMNLPLTVSVSDAVSILEQIQLVLDHLATVTDVVTIAEVITALIGALTVVRIRRGLLTGVY